jgi:arylsulfatase A-like enzyme
VRACRLAADGAVADLGYHNVGFHNPEQISPHINGLVEEGILLEAHYTFQFCSPTRSAFLSGRLPIHVNMEQPTPGSKPGGIDLRMELISQVLKKANYHTHFIGKGHIGAYSYANLPIQRGFDSHLGFLGGAYAKKNAALARFALSPMLCQDRPRTVHKHSKKSVFWSDKTIQNRRRGSQHAKNRFRFERISEVNGGSLA